MSGEITFTKFPPGWLSGEGNRRVCGWKHSCALLSENVQGRMSHGGAADLLAGHEGERMVYLAPPEEEEGEDASEEEEGPGRPP